MILWLDLFLQHLVQALAWVTAVTVALVIIATAGWVAGQIAIWWPDGSAPEDDA